MLFIIIILILINLFFIKQLCNYYLMAESFIHYMELKHVPVPTDQEIEKCITYVKHKASGNITLDDYHL